MKIRFVHLASAALICVGAAGADPQQISVEITYDKALLESEDGARVVKRSVRRQAREACKYDDPSVNGSKFAGMIDHSCAQGIYNSAIAAIGEKQRATGQPVPREFSQLTR